jgi:hypothetical protein
MTENGNGWLMKGIAIAAAGVLFGAFSTAMWWNFTTTVEQGKDIARLQSEVRCK